jgi:hypothetical protein
MKKILWIIVISLICNQQNNYAQSAQQKTKVTTGSQPKSPLNTTYYSNGRFVYFLKYPTLLLIPQEESTNGDGKVFTDKSGNEILRVYGRLNQDTDGNLKTLSREYKDQIKYLTAKNDDDKVAVTYQKTGKTFFVISGLQNGKIYYQKTIQKDDAFATAIIRYDIKDSATYNKIAEAISTSFQFMKNDSTGKYYPNSY